ncbi:MAG: hypothetical protein WAM42_09135 [Candidatus Nitrosopolaris sp.]
MEQFPASSSPGGDTAETWRQAFADFTPSGGISRDLVFLYMTSQAGPSVLVVPAGPSTGRVK